MREIAPEWNEVAKQEQAPETLGRILMEGKD